jgi:hypothetical protein
MGFALILQRSATPTVPRVGRRPNYRAETRISPFDDKTSHAALSEPEDTTKVQFNSGSGPQPFNQERHLVTREIYKQRRWLRWPNGAQSWPDPHVEFLSRQTHTVVHRSRFCLTRP